MTDIIKKEKLKWAQDLIKTSNPSVACGFNMFIMGDKENITFSTYPNDAGERQQGYNFAEKMAKEGKIYFTHVFKCSCGGGTFMYGGFYKCVDCRAIRIDRPWWTIKVEKDGDQFCCHGIDFINLQESENYAFGETFNLAIDNYEKTMIKLTSDKKA